VGCRERNNQCRRPDNQRCNLIEYVSHFRAGALLRGNDRPVAKVAGEQMPARALKRIVKREPFLARLASLNPETNHIVVYEDRNLHSSVVADFIKRSASGSRIALLVVRFQHPHPISAGVFANVRIK
jgi:hypothetical protein